MIYLIVTTMIILVVLYIVYRMRQSAYNVSVSDVIEAAKRRQKEIDDINQVTEQARDAKLKYSDARRNYDPKHPDGVE